MLLYLFLVGLRSWVNGKALGVDWSGVSIAAGQTRTLVTPIIALLSVLIIHNRP